MTAPADQPVVCGAQAYLPTDLVALVLRAEKCPGAAVPSDVTRDLRCTQEHQTATHWAVCLDLEGPDTGSVWTCWTAAQPPQYVVVLADCPDARGCSEYDGHPGGHTADVHDPLGDPAHILP